jgi:hypothetical protein
MIAKCLTSEANRFGNGVRRYIAAPLFYDGLPGSASGDLLENVWYEDPGSAKDGLAVTDRAIGDDVPADEASNWLSVCFSHDYALSPIIAKVVTKH